MQKLSLTGIGIEGAIKDIERYFDEKIAAVPMPEKKHVSEEKEANPESEPQGQKCLYEGDVTP